ncbi:phosphoribosylanthranilate isomerase [Hypnocyclicus thermotrophus]|uniref:N-(5'-phosphoribosyl)anthranilate isomerase n=1 Tax=Hypnocyclicus thermotrophus TaxID=1627895 RepID=A0AA46DZK7_9FUSO|nr:phosphoribosylanthranilate isomerase [Hypnocyclicus thermotrophus]TDT71867.1 phosphoribosylanthranilate isomerase [Hypnocyclicus thermotrophus]
MKIKICGIRRKEDIDIINKYNPDYIGIIFYPKSKRYIKPNIIAPFLNNLNPNIKKVGVFVNETFDTVNEISNICNLDIIQLHGNEDIEYIKNIKKTVWKALSVKNKNIKKQMEIYKKYVEIILLDNGKGGTGKTFNWKYAKNLSENYKIALAGGININNVKEAIKIVNPSIIDISSGVEINSYKDEEKIKNIINLIRNI